MDHYGVVFLLVILVCIATANVNLHEDEVRFGQEDADISKKEFLEGKHSTEK